MAATITVIKTYGAPAGSEATVTTPGLIASDDNADPVDSKLIVPSVNPVYSYECWLRFKCTVAPDNTCENFKIWSSGASVGTGLTITVNSDAVAVYAQPVNTESAQGTRVDFSTKDSGDKISVAGDLVDPDDKTDFSVFQMKVENTAGAGNKTYTVYYSYDES